MTFYSLPNAVTKSVVPCVPWEFQATETITDEIRNDKEARQAWYKRITTKHCLYSAYEGCASNQRVSKENPPRLTSGFVADYDIAISRDKILDGIKQMPFLPTYLETSLGGKFRLVWLLTAPLRVESNAFAIYLQQQAIKWLKLDLLPGLDQPAFEDPARHYCNGCAWEEIGGPIEGLKSQAFFVECGKGFRFKGGDNDNIPLDVVEKSLREKFTKFDWPGDFTLESQGPSFWVENSVSAMSAIVKSGGMFTFAQHAEKPFYSWTDLLGSEFTSTFQKDAVARATEDVWWDSKSFWRKIDDVYTPMDRIELTSYFKVTCRLGTKKGQSGNSQLDEAFEHIFNHQRVVGAAPFVFRQPGLILHDHKRKLNTYSGKVLDPAGDGKEVWGPSGRFPFISLVLEGLFDPRSQLYKFLAPLRHFYVSALNHDPHPGQNYFLMGPAGIGKTLVNREFVGGLVGGYVDASDYIVGGATFNSYLFERGLWVIDDEAPAGSSQAMLRTHMMFKKVAANQQHLCNAKFLTSVMLEWMGRIGCTTNLDFISTRIVGPLDNSSQDKINLFRCAKTADFIFPNRTEIHKLIQEELKHFARWLADWEPPADIEKDSRYGYVSHQEPSLLDQTYQSSPAASFKELLIEFLSSYFQLNPSEPYWEGTTSMLMRGIIMLQGNEVILKSLKLEQTSRFLEQLGREGGLKSEVVKGNHNTRIWRFYPLNQANDNQPPK